MERIRCLDNNMGDDSVVVIVGVTFILSSQSNCTCIGCSEIALQ